MVHYSLSDSDEELLRKPMLTVATPFAGVATAAESVNLRKKHCMTIAFYFSLSLILAVHHAAGLLSHSHFYSFSPAGLFEVATLEALLSSKNVIFY